MKTHIALLVSISLAASLISVPLYAKDSKKSAGTCPGGLMACVERCKKAGGQPRFCPDYCKKTAHCQ